MIIFNIIIALLIIHKFRIDTKLIDFKHGPCLPQELRASWTRDVFNDKSPLTIESTRRPSHKLVSFILAILLKERLGYNHLRMRETRWEDTTETLNRMTCNKRSCGTKSPLSHINLEVWMPPGFTSREWVSDNLIIDCGPLGPSARTGIFYYNDPLSESPMDDWRLMSRYSNQDAPTNGTNIPIFKQLQISRRCNESDTGFCRTKFAIDPELPIDHAAFLNKIFNNWTVGALEADSSQYLFFNWYPNTLTVQYNFSRVLFPDCNDGRYSSNPGMCEDYVNQLTKVIWSGLKTKSPLIYNLIDSFHLSDNELFELLKKSKVHSNTDSDYFENACQWILGHKLFWMALTKQWNSTKYLKVILMLPRYQRNISLEETQALQHAVDALNTDVKYFGTLQYQLQINYNFVSCGPNEMLEEYLKSIDIQGSETDNPILGIITGLPTECMELISKITNAQRTVTISYRHEILPISLRYKSASYIFQTSSSKVTYYSLLLQISKYFRWANNILITDNQDHKDAYNGTYILKIQKANEMNEEILGQMKKSNAKIFMVDVMGEEVFKILCYAGKLRMTSENKYVWFINMGLVGRKIPSQFSWCTENIELITRHYFYLTPNDEASVSECGDLYPDNLHRAMTIFGRAASRMAKMDPGFTTFNADTIVKSINEISTGQYFCSSGFQGHKPVKMKHNSLFWPNWYLFSIDNSKYIPIFQFNISHTYALEDVVLHQIRQLGQAFSGPVPDDGRTVQVEQCWATFLAKPMKMKCINAEILIIIVTTIMSLFLLVVSLVVMYIKKIRGNNYPMMTAFNVLVKDLMDIDIHSSKLCLNHIIGRGAFGMVYGGEARSNNGVLEAVAVKAISENSDWVEKMNFLSEARVMRQLLHPNIVELIGVSLDSENNMIFLIMELMVEGDLRNYLLSRRSNAATNPDSEVLKRRLSDFSRDIAEGLSYMHSKFMVHRDVACRNCLISHDIRVKLGDFGLTQYLQPASQDGSYKYHGNQSLPVRWMPPEAIQLGLFSIKSDIWSFGVLLFEIVTFGVCPYQDLSSSRNIELMERIRTNNLSIKNYLPLSAMDSFVHQLISKCCSYNLCDRPDSMMQILALLKSDKTCIKPYLTEDPPKSEVDKKLDNLSVGDLPKLMFEEEELPVTSPSEVLLTSSQRYIDMINRAFKIKPSNMKERGECSFRELRPCQSSGAITRDLLSADVTSCMSFSRTPDLLVGSIPSGLCHNMGTIKSCRTPVRSFSNFNK